MPGLTQPVLSRNNIKVGVVDFYEAPLGTQPDDATGLWKNMGVIEPGSFKFDPKADLFFFESGVPATPKAAFVIGIKGEADLNFAEYTMGAVRAITGQREPKRFYETSGGQLLAISIVGVPGGQAAYNGNIVYCSGDDASKLVVGDQIQVPTTSPLDFGEGVGLESTIITKITALAGGNYKLAVYPKIHGSPSTSVGVAAHVGAVTVTDGAIATVAASGASGTANAGNFAAGSGYVPFTVYQLTVTDAGDPAATPPVAAGTGARIIGLTNAAGAFTQFIVEAAGSGYVKATTTISIPAPLGTGSLKRLSGYKQILGTSTIREMSYMAVFTDTKGDQGIIWVPKAAATGGLAPNFGDGKKQAMLPLKLTCYGVQADDVLTQAELDDDPTLAGQPVVAAKWVIRASGTAGSNLNLAKITL